MRKIKPAPLMDLKVGNVVILNDGTLLADGLRIRDDSVTYLKNHLPNPTPLNRITSLEETPGTSLYKNHAANKAAFMFEDGSSCEVNKVNKNHMQTNMLLRNITSFDDRIPYVYTVKSGRFAGRKVLSHPEGLFDITDQDNPFAFIPRMVGDPTTTSTSGTTNNYLCLTKVLDDDSTGFELLTHRGDGGIRVSQATHTVHPQVRVGEDFVRPFNRSANVQSLPLFYRADKKVGFYVDSGVDPSGQYTTRSEIGHLAAYLNENKGITLTPRAVLGNKTVTGQKFIYDDFKSQNSVNNTPFKNNSLATNNTSNGFFTHEVKRYCPVVRSLWFEENRTHIFFASPDSDNGTFASAKVNGLNIVRNVFNHATETFTEIPMSVRNPEGGQIIRWEDDLVDVGGNWDNVNLRIWRANQNFGSTTVTRSYEAHSLLTFIKTYGNETYLIVLICPTEESQSIDSTNYYPANTVQYTLRLDKEDLSLCYLVNRSLIPGFFGRFNEGLQGFCSDSDYDNLYFISKNEVFQVTYSKTEHRFESAPISFDLDVYALHVSPNNNITMIDTSNKLYQVRSSLANVVEVDFDNPFLVYEEIPRDTFVKVNVRNVNGDRVERAVRLILDGPAIFRDNGSRQMTVTTDFIEDTRVAVTLTGYGDVHITPAEIQE